MWKKEREAELRRERDRRRRLRRSSLSLPCVTAVAVELEGERKSDAQRERLMKASEVSERGSQICHQPHAQSPSSLWELVTVTGGYHRCCRRRSHCLRHLVSLVPIFGSLFVRQSHCFSGGGCRGCLCLTKLLPLPLLSHVLFKFLTESLLLPLQTI